jgi:hypothetical protein
MKRLHADLKVTTTQKKFVPSELVRRTDKGKKRCSELEKGSLMQYEQQQQKVLSQMTLRKMVGKSQDRAVQVR